MKRGILCTAILALGAAATARGDVTFGVIGDYGGGSSDEGAVAQMVKSWSPDFIATVGDNNYPLGEAATIDANIGQFYHEYIGNYAGSYGAGSAVNRFFPALGNHDWGNATNNPAGANPYKTYFTLPGNERYYDFAQGPVHFFVLDSDPNEPDSVSSHRTQGQWLKSGLAAASEPFKVVLMHHAPYSSGSHHGSQSFMQWPYKQWGATAVMAGHDHQYERLSVSGIPYFVNGAGGYTLYSFGPLLPQSQAQHNATFGAMKVTASAAQMRFDYYSMDGVLQDSSVQAAPAEASAYRATKTFQQGAVMADGVTAYAGTRDTFVDGANPSASNAASAKVTVDGSPVNQGLIRFSGIIGWGANQIPPGATIEYANLRLVTGVDANDQSANSIGLYPMKRAWSDASTFNDLVGGIVIGDDCAGASEFAVKPTLTGVAMNFDVTATLREWVNDAGAGVDSNFGWAILNGLTDGWRLSSSESPLLLDRPALEVTYTPEPGMLGLAVLMLGMKRSRRGGRGRPPYKSGRRWL